MLRLLILCYLLFISSAAVGQLATGYRVQSFTTDNGLPSNGIKGLQWDEQNGFLWIATEAGVARFNGVDLPASPKKIPPVFLTNAWLTW